LIIITICGFFFGEEAITGQLYGQINESAGNVLPNRFRRPKKRYSYQVVIFCHNIWSSNFIDRVSGVFAEIQSSINCIWGLPAMPDKGLKKLIQRIFSSDSKEVFEVPKSLLRLIFRPQK
jgi:membrane protein